MQFVTIRKTVRIAVISLAMLSVAACTAVQPAQANPVSQSSHYVGKHAVVAVSNELAAKAGLDILKKGGNVFDAAVAVSMTLSVVEPQASGIGGGGIAVFYDAKKQKSRMLDFREAAPAKATRDMYPLDSRGRVKDNASSFGYRAVAVPGQLRGMEELHKRYGKLKWSELFESAIYYAENGAPATKHYVSALGRMLRSIDTLPSGQFIERTFTNDGFPLQPGDSFKNPDLAKTMRLLAKGGADVFYKGAIAAAIVREFEKPAAGGWITKQDLANYRAIWREPIQGKYRDFTVVSAAPPSSGGLALVGMLNVLEGYDMNKLGYLSPEHIHLFIQAQRLAYADRQKYMADPAFAKIPVTGLTSKEYARSQRLRITDKDHGVVGPGNPEKYESGNTTSFSIADKDGNMITITQTINLFFGSGVVPEGTGILLNDEMHDFTADPASANAPEPGKRPLSSVTPTLLLKDGKPYATFGAPGASRIITAMANAVINIVDFNMDLRAAVDAPRINNGNNLKTEVEDRIPIDILRQLEGRNHQFKLVGSFSGLMGSTQGIMYLSDGSIQGVGDQRREGVALGF